MEVRNVRWLGIRTDNYEAMVGFLRDILGLKVNFEEPTTVEFTTSEGDRVQVMAPADPYYDFFGEHANGPVPLFEVDDVHSAGREHVGVDPRPRPGRQPVRVRKSPILRLHSRLAWASIRE